MNTLGKFILSILFVPVLFVLLVSISVRFQILNSDFWTSNYEKHNIYKKLEQIIPKAIEVQIKKEGVNQNINQISQLSPFFKEDNLRITVEKNIENSISYFNGMAIIWMVYLPTETLLKGFLPTFLVEQNEVPLTTLISFFSRSENKSTEIPLWVPFIGSYSWTLLAIASTVFLCFIFILFTLKVLHTALLVSGILTIITTVGLNLFLTATEIEWVKETDPSQILLGALGIPIVREIANLWLYIAIGVTLIGIILSYLPKKIVK